MEARARQTHRFGLVTDVAMRPVLTDGGCKAARLLTQVSFVDGFARNAALQALTHSINSSSAQPQHQP